MLLGSTTKNATEQKSCVVLFIFNSSVLLLGLLLRSLPYDVIRRSLLLPLHFVLLGLGFRVLLLGMA